MADQGFGIYCNTPHWYSEKKGYIFQILSQISTLGQKAAREGISMIKNISNTYLNRIFWIQQSNFHLSP